MKSERQEVTEIGILRLIREKRAIDRDRRLQMTGAMRGKRLGKSVRNGHRIGHAA